MSFLDSHSATFPCSSSIERMKPFLEDPRKEAEGIELIYDFIGAKRQDQFVFTSSAAEAINQVLLSVFLEVSRKEGKCHFIASALEDAPTMQMMKRLEDLGCTIKIAPVDSLGAVDCEKLKELINSRTALVSVCAAQGLTGVVQPIEEIGKICAERNVLFHCEATYAVGKMSFCFSDLQADYFTFSGDRIHGLRSSGALFAKEKKPLVPLILGGSGLRGGAADLPSLASFSAACSQAALYLDSMNLETVRLRDLLESELEAVGAQVLYKEALRLPNTTAIHFPRVHQEALLYLLERKGVFASIGGAYCQHLHRLASDESALSFSLSRNTTEEEIRNAVPIIREALCHLQSISKGIFE